MNGSKWVTVAAPSPCWHARGELYFEVEVCEAVGDVLVGFAGANLEVFFRYYVRRADIVTNDDTSWAIYTDGNPRHR
jgi:hypothetical protein